MKKKILSLIIAGVISQGVAVSAPFDNGVIPQAGTMNTHDMETLKNKMMEDKATEDFKNYKKHRKEKEQLDKQTPKKEKKKIIKAKAEEYATKGVYAENIKVSPSQILTQDEIQAILEEYIGTNVTFDQLQGIVKDLNRLYLKKGFVTARAYIPEQTIEGGIINIELFEGKFGNVNIYDNKWTKKRYIEKQLDIPKGEVFNVKLLEERILNFNRYNDTVQLTGDLEKGEEIGTTDINIRTHERLPFHLTALMDNAGRSTIGKFRGGLMLQDDSLLGYRDKLILGAYANKHSVTPFADYSFPVNKKDGRIGFNYSSSFSKIAHGPYKMFNIKSRSHNYSLYFNQPIIRKPWMEFASTTSIGYKQATTRFDGYDLYTDKITFAQTGLNFRYDSKRGIWYLNQSVYYAFPIFQSQSNYLKLEGGLLRIHDFGHGIVGTVRGNYQIIPKNLVPYIDQFVAGGVATVRGYSEGLLIGRSGYILSGELMFPVLPRTIKSRDKTKEIPFLGSFMKMFGFIDHAYVFPYKGSGADAPCYNSDDVLISMGLGFRFSLPGDISLRICWGFPLMRNNYEENPKCGRFHFELSLTPDFDALVKMRKPKGVENVKIDDGIKVVSNKKSRKNLSKGPTVIKSLDPFEVNYERAPHRIKKFKDTTVFPELWNELNKNDIGNIMPIAYFRTVLPEIWVGINGEQIGNVEPVSYVKGQCAVKQKKHKIFKKPTVMPELSEMIKVADIEPITYTKGLCYPKRYKKFKAVTVMPELSEMIKVADLKPITIKTANK